MRKRQWNSKWSLVFGGGIAVTALLMSFHFNSLEAALYDFRMSHLIGQQPDPSIVLIALDDSTTKALDEISPLPLDIHARFLEAMERLSPKAVGYLVDFTQVNQLNPDLFSQEWGKRFVDAAIHLREQGTTILLGTSYDNTGEVVPPFPLSELPHAVAILHRDGNVFAEDKVTRRALVQLDEKPVFHTKLAQAVLGAKHPIFPRGTFNVPEAHADYFFFK